MAIKVSAPEVYQDSFRKLFPRGPYWDKQFDNPASDCSLFCKVKANLLVRIRKKMSVLWNESLIISAEETLDDWERVLLGVISTGLDTNERRAQLIGSKAGNINIEIMKEIGRIYGLNITDVTFPFRPAFFGFTRFGTEHLASPAVFSVLFIYINIGEQMAGILFEDNYRSSCYGFTRFGIDRLIHPRALSAMSLYVALSDRSNFLLFEDQMKKKLLANYIINFIYGGF